MATVPRGGRLRDRFVLPDELPAWLTEADLDFYTAEFEAKGFRGALNRYRNVDRDWLDLQPWSRQPITVPSLFIGGERDGPTIWGQRAIDRFPQTLPGSAGQPHPAGLRPLGPAGAGRGGQRPAGRLAEESLEPCPGRSRRGSRRDWRSTGRLRCQRRSSLALDTEMRMQRRPFQTVPPIQQVPSRWTASMT